MKEGEKPSPVGVRYLEIDRDRAGQRLDNFLLGQLKGVPKSRVYRLLRRGEVRVNRGRAGPDYRLQAGDSVRLPPVRQAPAPRVTPATDHTWLLARILYEDDELLALDKPAGFAVHGGSGVAFGAIEALRLLRPETALDLVHRLDRDTSGCLLFAKSRPVLLELHRMLRAGRVHKQYLALLKGHWHGGARDVSAALARNRRQGVERLVGVTAEGKEAKTRFNPRGRYGNATLAELELITGRTHQARVHAAHVGHPIAGDDKYGDRSFNRLLRPLGLRRLFLHAAALRFIHPVHGGTLHVEAPLPVELNAVLERLRHDRPV